ncbi:MAG: chloride channel protein [Bacteriovoracia bacterium]
MLIRSLFMGFFAASVAFLPRWVWTHWPQVSRLGVVGMLAVGLFMTLMLWLFTRGRVPEGRDPLFGGVGDLILQIHAPTHSHLNRLRNAWGIRSFVSLIAGVFGGVVGPEGAATEVAHGFAKYTRSRSSQWFEQQRRTDFALAAASGISAAFGAPLAAAVLSSELRIGGYHLYAVVSSVTAFFVTQFLEQRWHVTKLVTEVLPASSPDFQIFRWTELFLSAPLAVVIGIFAVFLIQFSHAGRSSLRAVFAKKPLRIVALMTLLLMALVTISPTGNLPGFMLFRSFVLENPSFAQIGLVLLANALVFTLVVVVMGSFGVFWPVYLMGALIGYTLSKALVGDPLLMTYIGGSALFGAVFSAPITAVLIAYEMSGNVGLVLPCFIAAAGARYVRKSLATRNLFNDFLMDCGLTLQSGRSVAILEGISVKDAMVTDFQRVEERESVDSIFNRFQESGYPFLAVVSSRGLYKGLITMDMIEESRTRDKTLDPSHSRSTISGLLEAKDLLYRYGNRFQSVYEDNRLAVTTGIFDSSPVAPVLNGQGEIVGLLFSYHVRISYDREVARRSFLVQTFRTKQEAALEGGGTEGVSEVTPAVPTAPAKSKKRKRS